MLYNSAGGAYRWAYGQAAAMQWLRICSLITAVNCCSMKYEVLVLDPPAIGLVLSWANVLTEVLVTVPKNLIHYEITNA